jgi:transcriptional regulator with XRE-family HTH domain
MRSKFGIEKMDHTTPNQRNDPFLVPFITFSMLLGVGTGGDYSPSYHVARSEKSAFSRHPTPSAQRTNGFAIAKDIEYTKTALNLTMSELARGLGVSRQALYNWIDGGPIKDDNLAKLNDLKSAADVIVSANLPQHALLLRRKLPGGKTLLETAGSGAVDAAHALVQMVKIEAEQRAALAKKFDNRQPQNLLGYGTPTLTRS